MKKALTILLLLALSCSISAQEKPSFVSINAGTSIPLAGFYSKKLPEGGFALTGLAVSAEGAWFIKPWLGIGANAGMNLLPVDVVALGYEKAASDPFIIEGWVRSDPYFTAAGYAGLFFNVPVVQRLSFTAKALGGIMFARTPYQLYKAEYFMIGVKWFEVTSSEDFEASFLAGAGFRYDLNSCLGLVLNSEYTYNQCDFGFVNSDGTSRTDQRTISFININLGLLIRL